MDEIYNIQFGISILKPCLIIVLIAALCSYISFRSDFNKIGIFFFVIVTIVFILTLCLCTYFVEESQMIQYGK